MADRVEIRDAGPTEVRDTGGRVTVVGGLPGEAGAPGTAAVGKREQPVGDIDGVNLLFTTSTPFALDTTLLYLNGLAQCVPDDYSEISTTEIAMVEAPLPGDRLLITYVEVAR